ncbi:MAG: NUDIX domain-containing protein [Microbacterium sp.]
MATPDFILALREKIGRDLLWLIGVTAVVLRGEGEDAEVLLVRRSDNGRVTPVTGIVDPGEEPAAAAIREVREEADVTAVAESLAWVHSTPEMTFPNGDRCQFLDLTFRCTYVAGAPAPADGENTDAFWRRLSDLADLDPEMRARISTALAPPPAPARFEP